MAASKEELRAAIRAHCLECSGGSRAEVRRCRIENCALYRYRVADRHGSAYIKGQMTLADYMKEVAG